MEKNPLLAKSVSVNDRRLLKAEKSILLNKSSSFSVLADRRQPPPRRAFSSIDAVWNLKANSNNKVSGSPRNVTQNGDHIHEEHQSTQNHVYEEIDAFIEKLSSVEDVSNLPKIPQLIEKFTKMVQLEIDKYDGGENSALKFGDDIKQDTYLLNAASRVLKLSNFLKKFPSSEEVSTSLTLTTPVAQQTITFLEEELRIILEYPSNPSPVSKTPNSAKHSKAAKSDDQKQGKEEEGHGNNNYPGISEKKISNLRRIASVMISSGHETECCQVYSIARRNAFKEAMNLHGLDKIDKISTDDVQKMQWEPLEGHIVTWINIVKYVAKVLLPGEKALCDSVFSEDHPTISEAMFSNLIRSTVILLLNFAEAISTTKCSAERLFKVLDIYDTLTELMSALDELCSNDCADELRCELSSVKRRLGESAVFIFCDLENSIKNDVSKNVNPTGAVHPLTRYTMNYLRYACDFKETLEQVFSLHHNSEQHLEAHGHHMHAGRDNKDGEDKNHHQHENSDESGLSNQTPFAMELMTIMNLLDDNLEAKSKLYKDPSLRSIFLMNNGRYIIQKMKESAEIHELVGNAYRRKRSSDLRGYHKSYQRETWSRVLQTMNQEGLQVNGKVQKVVLKERFKSFNQMLDEIHKTQSCWVVSDEQLQSELRVSISAVMIPAYRSFLARFGQYFTSGRQSEKYIKYQPEDIEATIEGLFDGSRHHNASIRRKT